MNTGGSQAWRWQAGHTGLHLDGLRISFQRFALGADQRLHRAPASLGALPVAKADDVFLIPLAEDEGFWLGLESEHTNPIALEIRDHDGSWVTVASRDLTAFSLVQGLTLPDGSVRPFSLHWPTRLRIRVGSHVAHVDPCDRVSYTSRTGEPAPPPLDPSSAFGGWRLP